MALTKNRGMRVVLAGSLLAIAASMMPAHAAGDPAPVLQSTSLVNGWSPYNRLVSADYDVALVRKESDITILDKNGVKVDGVTTLAPTDATILVFTPDAPLTETLAPYTATFEAHAVGQDAAIADTIDTASFKLDVKAPGTPTVTTDPAVADGGVPTILGPSDSLTFNGTALDAGLSGIAKVELHFFNPVEKLRTDPQNTVTKQRFDEVKQYRKTMTVVCGAACPASTTYSITVAAADLAPGYWTVKVAAVDLAGNVSPETTGVSFLAL